MRSLNFHHRPFALSCIAFVACVLGGCGGDGQIPRYTVSGQVTYGDQPIPYGQVIFAPDGSKQNSGPGCIALIRNGEYQTFAGQGVVGGPHQVMISGLSAAPDGSLPESEIRELFPPYQTTIDLPRSDTTHNFDIPAASR